MLYCKGPCNSQAAADCYSNCGSNVKPTAFLFNLPIYMQDNITIHKTFLIFNDS